MNLKAGQSPSTARDERKNSLKEPILCSRDLTKNTPKRKPGETCANNSETNSRIRKKSEKKVKTKKISLIPLEEIKEDEMVIPDEILSVPVKQFKTFQTVQANA